MSPTLASEHPVTVHPRAPRVRRPLPSMSALIILFTAMMVALLLAPGVSLAASFASARSDGSAAVASLTRATSQQVVLAQDDGLMLVGRLSAL
ncbi:MAG TPA: hypothetical protein VFH61_16990, partial [Thermoleophilia bacterium]|nr:hypothetical protein [Thermoleophilia bacterium]